MVSSRLRRLRAEIFPPLLAWTIAAVILLLAAQLPFSYTFRPGVERGPGSDLPFLDWFYPFEGNRRDGQFRWSRQPNAAIVVPGVGQRSVIVSLDIVSHRAQRTGADTPPLTLVPTAGAPIRIDLRRAAATYHVLVPAQALPQGVLRLAIDTPAWQPAGDSRDSLGIALGETLRVRGVGSTPRLPDLALLALLPLGIALAWPALRVAGFGHSRARQLLLGLAIVVPLLALHDAPRLAFGAWWSVQAALVGTLVALVAARGVPYALRVTSTPASVTVVRWLVLLMILVFTLKATARLYPESMPGDIQLHINRYSALVRGQHYIDAQHRGLPFPFPVGLYLLLAPFTLSGIEIRAWFQIATGAFEALAVPLTYALALAATGRQRLGLAAATLAALMAGGHMTAWFQFTSHVSTQFYQVLLMLVLVRAWPNYDRRLVWWATTLLLVQIGMGHIGTFLNMLTWGALIVPLLCVAPGGKPGRRAAWQVFSSGLAAALFVGLCFYSVYAPQFIQQLGGIATDGMNEVTGRNPIARSTTLGVYWQGGLITHYGFFPALLAIPGIALLARGKAGRGPLLALLLATLLSSVVQAALPLITLSSITARWLMFSFWVVALAGAAGGLALIRRGRAGRWAGVAMLGFVAWIMVEIWINAMSLRLPPIEPF